MNNQSISCFVVDDEPLACEGLLMRLEKYPNLTILGSSTNATEALTLCQTLKPDVIFLDIQMPHLNGFDFIQQLNERLSKQHNALPKIVFVTAYQQYAVDAFTIHALDYLLKPINQPRLDDTIKRLTAKQTRPQTKSNSKKFVATVKQILNTDVAPLALQSTTQETKTDGLFHQTLTVTVGNHKKRIPVKEIVFIEASGDYASLHTEQAQFLLRMTIKKLTESLAEYGFIRIHRSLIINIHNATQAYINDNGEWLITLTTGKQLRVSRSYRSVVKTLFSNGS